MAQKSRFPQVADSDNISEGTAQCVRHILFIVCQARLQTDGCQARLQIDVCQTRLWRLQCCSIIRLHTAELASAVY